MKTHFDEIRLKNEENVLVKHWKEVHEGDAEKENFEIKITGVHKTPLERLAGEGIRVMEAVKEREAMKIENKNLNILNSKHEFHQPAGAVAVKTKLIGKDQPADGENLTENLTGKSS